jgi:hypothetical protein
MSIATLVLLLVELICPVFSYSSDDHYVQEYLENLQSKQTPVFFVQCQLGQNMTEKAAVVFPIGQEQGLYIERYDQTVVNTADVKIVQGQLSVAEALGGVYTIKRIIDIIDQLSRLPFDLIQPRDIGKIATSKPKAVCKAKIPE